MEFTFQQCGARWVFIFVKSITSVKTYSICWREKRRDGLLFKLQRLFDCAGMYYYTVASLHIPQCTREFGAGGCEKITVFSSVVVIMKPNGVWLTWKSREFNFSLFICETDNVRIELSVVWTRKWGGEVVGEFRVCPFRAYPTCIKHHANLCPKLNLATHAIATF